MSLSNVHVIPLIISAHKGVGKAHLKYLKCVDGRKFYLNLLFIDLHNHYEIRNCITR